MQRSEQIQTLIRVAHAAGELLTGMQPQGAVGLGATYKGEGAATQDVTELVSNADIGSSALIHAQLSSGMFSGHTYIEEERLPDAVARAKGGKRIIVDPLDGTSEYLKGGKNWGLTFAEEDEQGVLRSVIYLPRHHQLFWAERGKGTFVTTDDAPTQDEQITLSPASLAVPPVVFTPGQPYMKSAPDRGRFEVIRAAEQQGDCITECNGSASAHFAGILQGKGSAFWAPSLGEWDVKAGMLLVNEAGGHAQLLHSAVPKKVGMLAAVSAQCSKWLGDMLGVRNLAVDSAFQRGA
jgi:myo-inositol-1(or 4)-monophosphatase